MLSMRERKDMIHKMAKAKENHLESVSIPMENSHTLCVRFYDKSTDFSLTKDGICRKHITSFDTPGQYAH